jgi:hypothetical protein
MRRGLNWPSVWPEWIVLPDDHTDAELEEQAPKINEGLLSIAVLKSVLKQASEVNSWTLKQSFKGHSQSQKQFSDEW